MTGSEARTTDGLVDFGLCPEHDRKQNLLGPSWDYVDLTGIRQNGHKNLRVIETGLVFTPSWSLVTAFAGFLAAVPLPR